MGPAAVAMATACSGGVAGCVGGGDVYRGLLFFIVVCSNARNVSVAHARAAQSVSAGARRRAWAACHIAFAATEVALYGRSRSFV